MSLTANQQSDAERRRTIRIAAISVFCVIAVTTLLGQQIISFFGISVGSLEVGGGIIMLLMAINMLNAQIGNSAFDAGRAPRGRVRRTTSRSCRWRFRC